MKNRQQIRTQISKSKEILAAAEKQLKEEKASKEPKEKVIQMLQFEIDSSKGILRALKWVLAK